VLLRGLKASKEVVAVHSTLGGGPTYYLSATAGEYHWKKRRVGLPRVVPHSPGSTRSVRDV